MATTYSDDEFGRAMQRCGAKPESRIENLARQNAFYLGIGKDKFDERLDQFINSHRLDPYYADSFDTPPQKKGENEKRTVEVDTLALSKDQFDLICAGKLKLAK